MLGSTEVENDRQWESPQKFTLASAERAPVVCNLLSTELDSSIRRYRARFCKAVDFANYKLTHHRLLTSDL
jgi:hypothetical protein